MTLLLLTFAYGVLSAIVPLFNMEAYLLLAGHLTGDPVWASALVGSIGMNIGKLFWYGAARSAPQIGFVRRRIEKPRVQAQVERWSARIDGRPWVAGGLNLVSAAIGIPPFFAMSIVAGLLRLNIPTFVITGIIGRFVFFFVIMTAARAALG